MLLDNVGESPKEEHSSHWSRAAGKTRRQRCSSACREQGHVCGRRVGAVQAAALTSSTCRWEETSESVEGMGQRAWAAGAGLLFCLTVQLTPECMFYVCLSVRARKLSWDTARLCRDEELGLQEPQSVSGAGALKELLFVDGRSSGVW